MADQINPMADNILQELQNAPSGTDRISIAKRGLDKVLDQVNSGQISQKDYLAVADRIYPQISQYINQLMGSGSQGATAGRNAGGEDFIKTHGQAMQIYKSANDLLGRDLTPTEFAQFKPYFTDPEAGRAAVAQFAQQDKNSPTQLAKRSGQYSGDVNGIMQDLLKRGATQDEVTHFGSLLASGQVDPYTLRQFVQQTPEYQTAQDKQFRTGLEDELQGYDQKFFNKAKDSVVSQFANNGTMGSSALDFALTNVMGDIASKRGEYLSGLSAQQYQGNKDAARSDYSSSMDKYLNDTYNQQSRSQGLEDFYLGRSTNLQDYNRQKGDLMDYMNAQPKRQTSPFDYLNAGLNVVNTGAKVATAFA